MNCVYVDTEVMGEEIVRVLIVRLKECGWSELRERIWQQQVPTKRRSSPIGLICIKARSPQSENHPP
jgi:hypothetical protein